MAHAPPSSDTGNAIAWSTPRRRGLTKATAARAASETSTTAPPSGVVLFTPPPYPPAARGSVRPPTQVRCPAVRRRGLPRGGRDSDRDARRGADQHDGGVDGQVHARRTLLRLAQRRQPAGLGK